MEKLDLLLALRIVGLLDLGADLLAKVNSGRFVHWLSLSPLLT